MVRLRSRANGAVVNVDDVTAARLGAAFVLADAAPEVDEKPKRSPGRPKKSES